MSKNLSELQLDVMRQIWSHKQATVAEVHAALWPVRGLALTTVATVMNRLSRDGILARHREGRTFVYSALITESEVKRSAVRELLSRLFGGSPEALVSHLVTEGNVTPGALEAVQAMLDEGDGDA